jgi:hypothetical protein
MWPVVKSKKRVVEALHNIAGSVLADQRNCSEKVSIEAGLKDEVVPPVVPIGRERREMAPIVDQGIDRQQAAFAAMNLPRGLALVEESFQRDYACHNSYKLLHQVAVAYHNAGSVVPVDPRTVDTLRTYYKISPLKAKYGRQSIAHCCLHVY